MNQILLNISFILIFGLMIIESEARSGGSRRRRSVLLNNNNNGSINSDLSDTVDYVTNTAKKSGKKVKSESKKAKKIMKKAIKKIGNKVNSNTVNNELNNIKNDLNIVGNDLKKDFEIIDNDMSKEQKDVNIADTIDTNNNALVEMKVDPSKEFDGNNVNVDNLMNNFKVSFEDDSQKSATKSNSITRAKKSSVVAKETQTPKMDQKKLDKLVKKVFGGGKNKHKPKRYSKNGKELKYYKDNGIPMIMRKVIPPRGAKLPHLQFEYVEGNSICRCSCKL